MIKFLLCVFGPGLFFLILGFSDKDEKNAKKLLTIGTILILIPVILFFLLFLLLRGSGLGTLM